MSDLVKILLFYYFETGFITMIFKNLEGFKGVKDKEYGVLPRRFCHPNTLHLNYLDYVTILSNPLNATTEKN